MLYISPTYLSIPTYHEDCLAFDPSCSPTEEAFVVGEEQQQKRKASRLLRETILFPSQQQWLFFTPVSQIHLLYRKMVPFISFMRTTTPSLPSHSPPMVIPTMATVAFLTINSSHPPLTTLILLTPKHHQNCHSKHPRYSLAHLHSDSSTRRFRACPATKPHFLVSGAHTPHSNRVSTRNISNSHQAGCDVRHDCGGMRHGIRRDDMRAGRSSGHAVFRVEF